MPRYVVDASIAAKGYFDEEHSAQAARLPADDRSDLVDELVHFPLFLPRSPGGKRAASTLPLRRLYPGIPSAAPQTITMEHARFDGDFRGALKPGGNPSVLVAPELRDCNLSSPARHLSVGEGRVRAPVFAA